MRKYETFFIVDPDLPDDVNAAVDEKIKTIVANNGGEVLAYDPWGKKKLAYEVNKRSRGLYVLMEYVAGPELVAELERNMRLDERVLKFITVKLADRYDPEKDAAIKAEAARRFAEEEERRSAEAAGEQGPEGELSEEEEGEFEEEE